MTYSEWVVNNWQRSVTYRNATNRIAKIKEQIKALEESIALVEKGEKPKVHDYSFRDEKDRGLFAFSVIDTAALFDSMHEQMFGLAKGELQRQRWEKEALEAEQKYRDDLARWLKRYRDGADPLDELLDRKPSNKLEYDSLPYLKNELKQAQEHFDKCVPVPPYDWRGLHGYGENYRPKDEKWYESAQGVLDDMLDCLQIKSNFDINESFANFIHDLSDWNVGFKFALYITEEGYTKCIITHRHVRKARTRTRDWNMWQAVLYGLLEFIDIHWDTLLKQRDEYVSWLEKKGLTVEDLAE